MSISYRPLDWCYSLFSYSLKNDFSSVLGIIVQKIAKNEYGIYVVHMLIMGTFLRSMPDSIRTILDRGGIFNYVVFVVMALLAFFTGNIFIKTAKSEPYLKLYNFF